MGSKIDWKEAREEFENRGLSFEELAQTFGCSRVTLSRKARKEGWHGKTSSGQIKEETQRPDYDETVVGESHRRLWRAFRERFERRADETELDGLKVIKAYADILLIITKSERLIWSIDDKGIETEPDDREEIATAMAQITLPQGAGKTFNGR